MSKKHGFTLMELMIVVVIIGLMAAFALPNYTQSVRKAYERDAISHLNSIHAANILYKSNALMVWQSGGADAAAINTALNLSITSDRLEFEYVSTSNEDYTADAIYTEAGDEIFRLRVNQDSIDTTNPCCEGTCFIIETACP